MNGYKIVSESIKLDKCVLLTGVSTSGKSHLSLQIAKKLHLKEVIELDEVMRQLVLKVHPKLKSFWKKDLIEYFGDMKKAKAIMWSFQLPALKQSLSRYRNDLVLLEGMIIYLPRSYSLIDSFSGRIFVIKPTSPQEHLRKFIDWQKKDNYELTEEDKQSLLKGYSEETKELNKFIDKYKDRIEFINN